MQQPVVVLDNGASTIKANIVTHAEAPYEPLVVTNAVVRSKGDKRTYFGHEFAQCRDFSSLHYRLPFERGYLTDWDAQKAVWDGLLSREVLKANPRESSLLITEPYFNLPNIQDVYDQFVFEEYEFDSYYRCTPAALIPYGALFLDANDASPPDCMLIVDSGFSFTHVVPLVNKKVMWKSVRRLDVGGKLLTNHLKEMVSFRQWNMMDETYIVNDIKEKCCYVSNNYKVDMDLSKSPNPKQNPIIQEYVLPNFSTNRLGRIKASEEFLADSDQVLFMNNERFAVPEVLFRPTDIGLSQSGLSKTIADAISSLPEDLRGLFWANIALVGGSVKFPGFRERLSTELRSLAPVEYEVHIYESSNPVVEAFTGGVNFVRQSSFLQQAVTRAEYLESGSNACRRKFPSWSSDPKDVSNSVEVGEVEKSRPKEKGKARARIVDSEAVKRSGRGTRARTTGK